MEKNQTKELMTSIEITRESIKNSMDVMIESYTEAFCRLNLMTYILQNEQKK